MAWKRRHGILSAFFVVAIGPGSGAGAAFAQPVSTGSADAYSPRRGLNHTVDAALGVGDGVTTAVSLNNFYGFKLLSRTLSPGLGIRVASYFGGDNVSFSTADADLIRANKTNVLSISGAQTNSVNLSFHLKGEIFPGFELGFDIDLIGFGFGNSRTGTYSSTDPSLAGPQAAHASSFNIFLFGKSDRGQLDSEFYAAYWLNNHWALRAGFSHFISEYTTDNALDFGNNRFRHSANLGFVGVSYRL